MWYMNVYSNITHNKQNRNKCLSTDELTDKMLYIHIKEYYLTLKKKFYNDKFYNMGET